MRISDWSSDFCSSELTAGAIAGMVFGFGAGTAYLTYVYTGGTPWLAIDHLRFGMIGMPVSLVALVVVSLLTPAPRPELQRSAQRRVGKACVRTCRSRWSSSN